MENKWIELGKYNRVRISKYRDTFSLQMGSAGKEKTYITWTNPLRYDKDANGSVPAVKQDGSPLVVPLQIPIGDDPVTAGNTIKSLYSQVIAMEQDVEKPQDTREYTGPPTETEGDISF